MGRPRKNVNAEFQVPVEDVEQPAAAVAPARAPVERKRQPLNGRSLKLQVFGEIPGYHLYVAKDDGARIQMMQQAGYEFVKRGEVEVGTTVSSNNTDVGDSIRFIMGSNGSDPIYGYLMKIPEEFWQEDQRALEARNQEIDDQIKFGQVNLKDDDKRYVPKGGIQYDPRAGKRYVPAQG